MSRRPLNLPKGRGSMSWIDNRFESVVRESMGEDEDPGDLKTRVDPDSARSIISENDSPDLGFSRSVNPYRGCEHGCVYCFARPTHAYLGLSPGLDFESRIFFKEGAAALLRKAFSKKRYEPVPIALGINTDSYQPLEEKLGVTRSLLEVFSEFHHPVTIVTKSSLIERDLDIMGSLASRSLIHVHLSITTLEPELAHIMEPRAPAPYRRLQTIRTLARAGIPVGVMVAPVVPKLSDHELEEILGESRSAGACAAGYVLLRLPLELKEIFEEWLRHNRPEGAAAILSRIRDFHGGELYRASFGERMRGTGPLADLLEQRFRLFIRKLGFPGLSPLDITRFRKPSSAGSSKLFPDF